MIFKIKAIAHISYWPTLQKQDNYRVNRTVYLQGKLQDYYRVPYVSIPRLFISLSATSLSYDDSFRRCTLSVWYSSVLLDWEGLALSAAWQVSVCHLCVALCRFGVGLFLPVDPSGRH